MPESESGGRQGDRMSRLATWEEVGFLLKEIDDLREERTKALELLAFEDTTDLLYAIEKRARQNREDRAEIRRLWDVVENMEAQR